LTGSSSICANRYQQRKWKDRLAPVSPKSGGFAPVYFDLVVDFVVVSSLSGFEPVVVLWPGA
jgi:hypothetical protein